MTESERTAARKAANAYKRKWAKQNPEKVRAAQERYWLKRAQQEEQEADHVNAK